LWRLLEVKGTSEQDAAKKAAEMIDVAANAERGDVPADPVIAEITAEGIEETIGDMRSILDSDEYTEWALGLCGQTAEVVIDDNNPILMMKEKVPA
jgi:negative regulator of replication initiation